MTGPRSPGADDRAHVAAQVREQLGAIFRTIRRGPGTCRVCAGPATAPLCHQCDGHRRTYGPRLADLVVPRSYAVKGHQSGHHMYGYKGALASSDENRRDLKYLVLSAMHLHRHCIGAAVGRPWSAVTFVSSERRPGATHPVVELAQQVVADDPAAARLLLDPGPDLAAERREGPLPSRFVLAEKWRP